MTSILAYQKRLLGPLLDRIDMIISVSRISYRELLIEKSLTKEQHIKVLGRMNNAKSIQMKRYNSSKKSNNLLTNSEINHFAPLSPPAKQFLDSAADKLKLSARSYFKIIKVARTVADIAGVKDIEIPHLAEALQYRKVT